MENVKDPVCGMAVKADSAERWSEYRGETYSFCSVECKKAFDADPDRYVTAEEPVMLEQHEPRWTKTRGGWVSPKFGAAGSGGAEYERLPEAHDKHDHPDKGRR